jgi:hypothetical protein
MDLIACICLHALADTRGGTIIDTRPKNHLTGQPEGGPKNSQRRFVPFIEAAFLQVTQ